MWEKGHDINGMSLPIVLRWILFKLFVVFVFCVLRHLEYKDVDSVGIGHAINGMCLPTGCDGVAQGLEW